MFTLMLAAAAVAAPAPTPTPTPTMPNVRSDQGDARTVVERQLRSPPRAGPVGGVSAEEADVIMQHYLSSIGKRLDLGTSTDTTTAQPQP